VNTAIKKEDLFRLPETQSELIHLIDEYRPAYIVLAGGTSFIPEIERDIATAIDAHIGLTNRIFGALAVTSTKPSKILTVGSASEYGPSIEVPINESTPLRPADSYGLIKAVQCQSALASWKYFGLNVVHARQFNASGIGQNRLFVLPAITRQIAKIRAQGKVKGTIVAGDLSAVRDFLDIRDVVTAYQALLEEGQPGQIYNVCSGEGHSVEKVIQIAARLAQVDISTEVDPSLIRLGEKRKTAVVGDPAKLANLGWKRRFKIDDILSSLLDSWTDDRSSD
jgi:GDP-4-dehydro-6-deoxy-D-mannose reductase